MYKICRYYVIFIYCNFLKAPDVPISAQKCPTYKPLVLLIFLTFGQIGHLFLVERYTIFGGSFNYCFETIEFAIFDRVGSPVSNFQSFEHVLRPLIRDAAAPLSDPSDQ